MEAPDESPSKTPAAPEKPAVERPPAKRSEDPSPALAMPARSWLTVLSNEWSLLLLALALTLIVWIAVRGELIDNRQITVRVVAPVAEDATSRPVFAEEQPTIALPLRCTQKQLESIQAQLADGIELDVGPVNTGTDRLFNNDQDKYQIAFPLRFLRGDASSIPFPKGRVVRYARQTVRFAAPALQPPDDIGITISSIDPQERLLFAPWGVFENAQGVQEDVQADPLTRAQLSFSEEQIDNPQEILLTFDEWRSSGPGRESVDFGEVRLRFTPHLKSKMKIQNRLVILEDGEKYDVEFGADRSQLGIGTSEELMMTGELVGWRHDLDALKKDTEGWFWALRIDRDERARLEKGEEGLFSARFYWMPLSEEFRNRNVRFEPSTGQRGFRVTVTRKGE